MFPTVILGVPDSPKEVVAKDAVDAVPVKLPTKLDAVTIPTVIFGVPDKPVAVPVTLPTKLDAVIEPAADTVVALNEDALTTPTTFNYVVGVVLPIPTLLLVSVVIEFNNRDRSRARVIIRFLF